MDVRRFGCLFAIAAALVLTSPSALGQTRADLEKARAAYLARIYAEAEERLRVLVDAKTGFKERSLLTLARMNLGAVLYAKGKKAEADDLFVSRAAVRAPQGQVLHRFQEIRLALSVAADEHVDA